LRVPRPASNALLVAPSKSADGKPIAVFGPQVGYYSPQILMEIDLHGPGVQARGAAFPGISIYVLLGRGTSYGWSATTAIGDHVDVRAVKLCNADHSAPTLQSTGYIRDGACHQMYRRTDTWIAKPSAGGIPDPAKAPGNILVSMTTERVRLGTPEAHGYDRAGLGALPIGPDWAIVVDRGTVGGAPVAFVRQRSSYGIEVDATMTYVIIHDPARVHSIEDLQHAFCDRFSFSFNWHLIDAQHVGFCTTGHYPVLASGVDGDLPYWGDSHWDWTRYLTYAEHPQAVDPAKGYITNWNNKLAPSFRAADDWWAYGPIGRMSLLEDGVKRALSADGNVSLAELTQAMGLAATQDLRGAKVLPYILDVIGTPSDALLAHVVSLLREWSAGGAHRRDIDNNGFYDQAPAAAVMDALWEPALRAAFEPVLREAFGKLPLVFDNGAGPGGSAYLDGWYGQLQKDLRQLLGDPTVALPFSRSYCGGGSLAACREALTAALASAVAAVQYQYGMNEGDWGNDLKQKDAIVFSPVGVVSQPAMAWQNRPTFQQVLEFGS
jgi:acyl-homoserine lactone acylase PvdQ